MFLVSEEFCSRLVVSLVHFIWQGAAIAIVTGAALWVMRLAAARTRYVVALLGLLTMAACVPANYLLHGESSVVTAPAVVSQAATTEQKWTTDPPVGGASQSQPGENPLAGNAHARRLDWPVTTHRAPIRATTPAHGQSSPPQSVAAARWWNVRWVQPLAWAYLTVSCLLLLRLGFGLSGGRRLRRAAMPVREPELVALVARLVGQLKLTTSPLVAWSDRVAVPTVVGMLRPCVLLPLSCACGLTPMQLEQVLTHELIHLRRYDHLVNLLQRVIEAALFFHPAAWWISRRVRLERELACDEMVVARGYSPHEYAASLLQVAELRERARASLAPAVGVAAISGRSELQIRIKRLLGVDTGPAVRMSGGAVLIVVLLAAVGIAGLTARRPVDAQLSDVTSWGPATPSTATEKETDGWQTEPRSEAAETTLIAQNTPKTEQSQPPQDSAVKPNELAGRVVDRDGKPIQGATIDAWSWFTGNEATTDADGRFKLTDFDPKQRAEIIVYREGYSPAYFPTQAVGLDDWVVTLGNQTYLEGVLKDAAGTPVADAEIQGQFGPIRSDGAVIGSVTLRTRTDKQGWYRLYVRPDTYELKAVVPGKGVVRQAGIAVRQDEAKTLDLVLQSGVRFEATVVDSVSGEPVEGFVLFQWRPPFTSARSDKWGRIVIEDMLPGNVEFNCGGGEPQQSNGNQFYTHGSFGRWWSPDAVHEHHRKRVDDPRTGWQRNFDDLEFDLSMEMKPVTIVVEQGVEVSGKVTDPDGKPVAGATVAPARTGSGNSLTGDTRYSVETKDDGTYQVVLPASGVTRYNFVAHDGKYGQWRRWANAASEPLQTKPGDKVANLDLQLHRPATVRGRVLHDGRVLAKRDVRAHAADKRGNRYYDPTTETEDDGSFELKFVGPGKFYIQVEPFWLTAEQAPEGSSVLVDLHEGENREGIELRVAPSAKPVRPALASRSFTARIVDAQGRPVQGVAVGLSALGIIGKLELPSTRLVTNAEGRVPLPMEIVVNSQRQQGTWVYALDEAASRVGLAKLFADAVKPEVEVRLQPAVRVTVAPRSLELKQLGLPFDLQYALLTADSMQLLTSEPNNSQTFEFLLPPGEFHMVVGGLNVTPHQAKITVPAGQRELLIDNIELKAERLAKLIGQQAPEFEQIKEWRNGGPVRLADLRSKVVVLDFWGYWCGPCLEAMPKLMKLHEEFAEKDVVFIAMHDGTVSSIDELMKNLAENKTKRWEGGDLPFIIAIDGGGMTPIPGSDGIQQANGATTAAYGIHSFPTTLLIDRKGKIVGRLNYGSPTEAAQQIQQLLDQAKR